jgi:hypothetical protein
MPRELETFLLNLPTYVLMDIREWIMYTPPDNILGDILDTIEEIL